MWPFTRKSKTLPGIERHSDGQVSFKFTDEEEAAITSFFQILRDDGIAYVRPDAHDAFTAWALIGYAEDQVSLVAEANGAFDERQTFQKALAAALKAYSLHSLPIYMFDAACIFEMLGETASARGAFESFLEAQRTFEPTDVDRIVLKQRDVEAAVKEAEGKIS